MIERSSTYKLSDNPQKTEQGLSLITFALVLPVILLLFFGAIQFFLYFRAASVVQRAAAEAAQVLASRTPDGELTVHSQKRVRGKKLIASVSGGDTYGNPRLSFLEHGQLYLPAGSKSKGAINLPFPLTLDKNGPNSETGDPGVHYLPFVSVWTCLEPMNETAHTLGSCGDKEKNYARQGFLTYQLPSRLDFDGDGHEDLAFFYPNTQAEDWWVIPSSSGALFRYSMRKELGIPHHLPPSRTGSLPCPADYDGDNMTDFCVVSPAGNSPKHRSSILQIRFSSRKYQEVTSFSLSDPGGDLLLPVPGRWTTEDRDSFAAVITESEGPKQNLATHIWPTIHRVETAKVDAPMFTFRGTPRHLDSYQFKPSPGRAWRPAFGDHDGDGTLDIGWLTWEGGYLTSHAAGSSRGTESRSGAVPATKAKLSPWKLHYPRSRDAAGLYVVERDNHRISLITPGSDGILNGGDDGEQYVVIAGANRSERRQGIPAPDPLSRGQFGVASVPTGPRQQSCPSCFPGGSYSGDNSLARQAHLNSPRDVYSLGRGPLFIADYGNARVRRISPGVDGVVNGSTGEIMETVTGGTVPAGVSCPPLANGNAGPKNKDQSVPWDKYGKDIREGGIHPRCVFVSPLSLEMDPDSHALFIGDEQGVVFAVYPGRDRKFNGSSDERISVLAGTYGKLSRGDPSRTGRLGFPVALAFYREPNRANRLLIVSRSGARTGGDGYTGSGGVVQVISNDRSFSFAASGAIHRGKIEPFLGSWKDTSKRAESFQTARTNLRNPGDISLYVERKKASRPTVGAFISTWWNDLAHHSFENALLHAYSRTPHRRSGSSADAMIPQGVVRWLNNPHTNSWGRRPPASSSDVFSKLSRNNPAPLATLPVEPGAGVALSPDNRLLYFSQTRLGQIMVVDLDLDGDGQQDLDHPFDHKLADPDIDGDTVSNREDPFPYHVQIGRSGPDTSLGSQPWSALRPLEIHHDPLMWAASASEGLDAAGEKVDRLEWWLDRIARTEKVPADRNQPIPPGEDALSVVFNQETIAAPNPRGALNADPVWPQGISRNSEFHAKTRLPRLAPVVLATRTPTASQLRHVSGYDQCSDWTLDESATLDEGLLPDGRPVSVCGRNLSTRVYKDGRTVGIRRTHLAQWLGHWPPFATKEKGEHALTFLDWDGDGVRDPALFVLEESGPKGIRPLTVHIGNLSALKQAPLGYQCPGKFAESELGLLFPVLRAVSDLGFSSTQNQYDCSSPPKPFFTSAPVPYVSILANMRAEWRTANITTLTSYDRQQSERMKTGTVSGPVADKAYRIVEHALTVKRRQAKEIPYDADVQVELDSGRRPSHATVTVTYVWPFNRFVAIFLGSKGKTITRSVRRRIYDFEQRGS